MLQGRWNLNLNRFRSRMSEKVQQKAERLTQKLVDGFIEASPVYRGHFRAAWMVSEGSPRFVQFSRFAGGTPESPMEAPRFKVKAVQPFPIFFITNGQPYAQKLEYGGSDQAPSGIVRVTIASLR